MIINGRARQAQIAQVTGVNNAGGVMWIGLAALIVTTVVSAGFAFWFSLENVASLAADVGIPYGMQKKIAPAIDIVVIGLTIVVQCQALLGFAPEYIRAAKRFLIGTAIATMLVNALPSVIGALTTDYTGPIMRATEKFTPTVEQLTVHQLLLKASIEAILPAILVYWSHLGPKLVMGFADYLARRDKKALADVELRTLATEADRAAAAAELAAAAEALAAAEKTAAQLVADAEERATFLRRVAEREINELRELAGQDAETIRASVSADLSADRAEAARELAEARRVHGQARASADEAASAVAAARREADRILADARAEAERTTRHAGHQVEMLNSKAAAELEQARQLRAEAAADKAAADRAQRESADNLRLAEQLLEEATADSRAVRGQRDGQPGGHLDAKPVLRPVPAVGARIPAAELVEQRVAAVKAARPDWAVKPPTQSEIAAILSGHPALAASGGSAISPVRKRLAEDAVAQNGAEAEPVPA